MININESIEQPILELTSSDKITNSNVRVYEVKGNSKSKSKIILEATDNEIKVVKLFDTDENGNFSSTINLLSLEDGTIQIKVIAENEKGSSIEYLNTIKSLIEEQPPTDETYTLTNSEKERWSINNNGENPVETTKGFNQALKWASENGFTKVKVENGVYLISKGVDSKDEDNAINMVSNMTLLLDENTVLKKETNNHQIYSIINFRNINNASIIGGRLIGDRDTHDYSKPTDDGLTTNTHEWGNAITTKGSSNITIDGVYIKGTTGDGLELGASTVGGSKITKFEKGAIDDNGFPIDEAGKIRSIGRTETNFDNKIYKEYNNFYMWLPEGNFNSKYQDIYFYDKDGKFIKSQKSIKLYVDEAIIPSNADFFVGVFDADNTNVKIQRMTVDLSENITVKNCEIDNTRRQGVSIVGSKNINILNNNIHDVRGTAPQSGIDIEPGYFPSINTIIKGNKFVNNKIQIVLAYGDIAEISDNYFEKGQDGSVGVYTYEGFRGLIANNNTFNGSEFYTKTENARIDGNSFENGASMNLSGDGQLFTNAKFDNSQLSVGNGKNQIISNIEMKLNGWKTTAFNVGTSKVTISNVTIQKVKNDTITARVDLLGGIGSNESSYDNIILIDEMQHGSLLQSGIFTNFHFDIGTLTFNREGVYVLTNGTWKSDSNLMGVNNLYGMPEIIVDNVEFEQRGNTGYGASLYIQGVKNFKLSNSIIKADANTVVTTPLIKLGGYGYQPNNTKILGVEMKNNKIYTKPNVVAINTTNAGLDAPPYVFEDNIIYNGKLQLTSKDIDKNNLLVVNPLPQSEVGK